MKKILIVMMMVMLLSSIALVEARTIGRGRISLFLAKLKISATSLSNDMLSWWRFNGNADDEQGLSNGIVTGATLTNGKFGQAYRFDGDQDYISIQNDDRFNFDSGSFSISLWVRPECNQPTEQGYRDKYVISKYNWDTDKGFLFTIDAYENKSTFYITDGTNYAQYDSMPNTFETNEWQHIVLIRDSPNSELKVYRNSKPIPIEYYDQASVTNISTDANLFIGRTEYDWSDYNMFNGSIDEVIIYDKVLSSREVRKLYGKRFYR